MKRMLKTALSLLLAAVIFVGAMPLEAITADAAGSLSLSAKYDSRGYAVVTVTPSSADSLVRYTMTGRAPKISSPVYFGEIIIEKDCTLRVAEFSPNGTKIAGIKKTIKLSEVKKNKTSTVSAPAAAETPAAEPSAPAQPEPAAAPAEPAPAAAEPAAPVSLAVTPSAPEFLMSCQQGKTTVTIGCATPGAEIYYTTDGSLPTTASNKYTGAFTVKKSTKITAAAITSGGRSDAVAITADVAAVSDGSAAPAPAAVEQPAPAAPAVTEQPAAAPASDRSKALNPDPDISEAKGVTDTLKYTITNMDQTGGTYVTLGFIAASSTVYYTTDGTAPDRTNGAKKYTKRVLMTEPGYFRAYEYNSKGKIVAKLSAKIAPICATPKMECAEFYELSRVIELTTATEGAKIMYTIDGTDPTKSRRAMEYTGPFSIGIFDEIKAIAVKDNCKNSHMLSAQAAEARYSQKDFDFSNPLYTQMADKINLEREKKGLGALVLDERFTRAANVRAEEINSCYESTRPDSTGFATAVVQAGVEHFISVSECFIAGLTNDPVKEIDRMMEKQSNVILDTSSNRLGVGHFQSENGGHYWVIIVGKVKD